MPIQLTCNCGRALRVKDEFGGRKVRCPACGKVVSIPRPEPVADVDAEAFSLFSAEPPPTDPEPRAANAILSGEEFVPPARSPSGIRPSLAKPVGLPRPARPTLSRPRHRQAPQSSRY